MKIVSLLSTALFVTIALTSAYAGGSGSIVRVESSGGGYIVTIDYDAIDEAADGVYVIEYSSLSTGYSSTLNSLVNGSGLIYSEYATPSGVVKVERSNISLAADGPESETLIDIIRGRYRVTLYSLKVYSDNTLAIETGSRINDTVLGGIVLEAESYLAKKGLLSSPGLRLVQLITPVSPETSMERIHKIQALLTSGEVEGVVLVGYSGESLMPTIVVSSREAVDKVADVVSGRVEGPILIVVAPPVPGGVSVECLDCGSSLTGSMLAAVFVVMVMIATVAVFYLYGRRRTSAGG
ncbi:MAG: hypothetical protein F7C35_09010 [Desulfurococcales archaeon]|nr:hypothetical protein [Desulfurococcales archaeon]